MARLVLPLTSRRSSGPRPPTATYASSTTVFRFSRGIACRPRVVSAKTLLMSVGTVVRSAGITSPSFSIGPLPLRGQQLHELLTDGGHAVYFGLDIGGDLDIRVQRQLRCDAGIGEAERFSPCRPGRRGR